MMIRPCTAFQALFLSLLLSSVSLSSAQTPAVARPTPAAATAPTAVPALVPYNGIAQADNGKPVSGETQITFLLFKDEQGGDPLWVESQTVAIDATGHYSVQLGASSPTGLPLTTFASGEGRWLEAQIAGQQAQPRVLLSSVPYAMKSADAEALAGHAATDFVTQAQLAQLTAQTSVAAPAEQPEGGGSTVTGTGTANTVPLWTGAATQGNSDIVQVGTDVGINEATPTATLDVGGTANIRGQFNLPSVTTATTASGSPSELLQMSGSAWSTTTNAAVGQNFKFAVEPLNNNTASPSSYLLLQYQSGTGAASNLLSIANTGIITFAPSQTFPGTITGAIGTSPIIAGISGHNIAVQLSMTALESTLNAYYGVLSGNNTFNGNQTIRGSLDVEESLSGENSILAGYSSSAGGYQSTGPITVEPRALATTSGAVASPIVELGASAYNSTAAAAVAQNFAWQAQVTGNNTASPVPSLQLQFGSGTAAPAATGLSIASNGQITFASGQTFPGGGGGGSGTITGITTTTPLTGSGTSGSVALGLNTSALETTLNSVYPQLGAANTFKANQTITGNASVSGALTAGSATLGTATVSGPITAGAIISSGVIQAQGGIQTLPSATATSTTIGYSGLGASSSAWNSSTNKAVQQNFFWEAEPANSNTPNPTADLDLMYGTGNDFSSTGLSIYSSGIIQFASGQTFPGAGGGTITGITTSSPLTGSGTSGSVALGLNETTLASDITPTLETTFNNQYAQLGASDIFTEPLMVNDFNTPDSIALAVSANNGSIGVLGGSDTNVGVYGTTTDGLGGVLGASGTFGSFSTTFATEENYQTAGVWGDSMGATKNTYAAGVIGTADNADGGSFFNNSQDYAAVYAENLYNATDTQTIGIVGKAVGQDGIGVQGSGTVVGLWGTSTSTTKGVGVGIYGILNSASTEGTQYDIPAGIWADTSVASASGILATADGGYAGAFFNNSLDYDTIYAENDFATNSTADVLFAAGGQFGGYCLIDVSGDLGCNGTVGTAVRVADSGRQVQTYSVQSAENWFEDAGTVQLVNGAAHVDLEPVFNGTVNTGVEYHVFLTPDGDCKGLYVSQKSNGGFDVRELGGGTSSIAFEYRIMAKRAGYENARLVDVTDEIRKHADQRALMHHLAPNRMQFRPIQSMEPPTGFAGRHRPQIRKPLPAARPVVSSAPAKPAASK